MEQIGIKDIGKIAKSDVCIKIKTGDEFEYWKISGDNVKRFYDERGEPMPDLSTVLSLSKKYGERVREEEFNDKHAILARAWPGHEKSAEEYRVLRWKKTVS